MKKTIMFSLLFLLCLSSTFGLLDVVLNDQHTQPLDLYFVQAIGDTVTLNNNVAIDDTVVSLSSVVNYSVGTYVGIFSQSVSDERFYFGEVLSILGNNITLDTPLDFNFSSADMSVPLTRDLNVDGSASCETFIIAAPPSLDNIFADSPMDSNISVDVIRFIVSMTMGSAGDDSRFGDIANGLTNGIVLRRTDGVQNNIFNVKTNGELLNLAFDGDYTDKSGGSNFGFRSRYTFGGQEKHGVSIRLLSDDSLDLIICDDLSSLVGFRVVASGHVVDPINNDSVGIIREEGFDMLINITIMLIILIIGLGFVWFTEKSGNYIWYIFGATWLLASAPLAATVLLDISVFFRFLTIGFFWLIAFIMIWEAVDKLVES